MFSIFYLLSINGISFCFNLFCVMSSLLLVPLWHGSQESRQHNFAMCLKLLNFYEVLTLMKYFQSLLVVRERAGTSRDQIPEVGWFYIRRVLPDSLHQADQV